jgi:hypothetical protein
MPQHNKKSDTSMTEGWHANLAADVALESVMLNPFASTHALVPLPSFTTSRHLDAQAAPDGDV